MLNREIPFRPKLEGDFRIRFYTAVSCINEETSPLQIEQICMNEINWVQEVCTYNLGQRKSIEPFGCFFVILQELRGRLVTVMAFRI